MPLGRFQMRRVSIRSPPSANSFQILVPGGKVHSSMSGGVDLRARRQVDPTRLAGAVAPEVQPRIVLADVGGDGLGRPVGVEAGAAELGRLALRARVAAGGEASCRFQRRPLGRPCWRRPCSGRRRPDARHRPPRPRAASPSLPPSCGVAFVSRPPSEGGAVADPPQPPCERERERGHETPRPIRQPGRATRPPYISNDARAREHGPMLSGLARGAGWLYIQHMPTRNAEAQEIARDCLASRARRLERMLTRIYDGALRGQGVTGAQLGMLVAIELGRADDRRLGRPAAGDREVDGQPQPGAARGSRAGGRRGRPARDRPGRRGDPRLPPAVEAGAERGGASLGEAAAKLLSAIENRHREGDAS